MMEDEHALTGIVREKYPELPYFLFGHSMGSFIARDYAAKYGAELTGVTICGTAGVFRGAGEAEEELKSVVDGGHGDEADPSYAGKLLGWMCERCESSALGNEWICSDPYVQKDHAEDPFDAFTKPTLNRSLYYFTQMMRVITGKSGLKKYLLLCHSIILEEIRIRSATMVRVSMKYPTGFMIPGIRFRQKCILDTAMKFTITQTSAVM